MSELSCSQPVKNLYKLTFPYRKRAEVNCYVLIDGDGLVLVDAGPPGCDLASFDRALEQIMPGGSARIHTILLTHGHPDHFGCASSLQSRFGMRCYLDATDQDYYRQWQRLAEPDSMAHWLTLNGVPIQHHEAVAKLNVPNLDLPVCTPLPASLIIAGQRWEFIHTPGHSPGHHSLYRPDDGVLITGDHVMAKIVTPLESQPFSGGPTLAPYLTSLRSLADLPVEVMLSGHGDPGNHFKERVLQLLDHHQRRLDQVLQACQSQPGTAFDISRTIWNAETPLRLMLFVKQALAYLGHLEENGLVHSTRSNGILYWSA